MPQKSVRISKALSNIALSYKNSKYIFGDVLRDVKVNNDSDNYWVMNSDFIFRRGQTIRQDGSPAKMVTWEASTSSYTVNWHSLKDSISENQRVNSDLDLDRITTEFVTDKILLEQEYEAHQLLFTTTSWSTNVTLTSATSWKYHTTTSAPIQNFLSYTTAITRASGFQANEAVMGVEVLNALKENQNVYNRLAYTRDQILSPEILASVMDLQKFHVGRAIVDASQEGETEAADDLWGDNCLIAYFDPAPGGKKPTAAQMMRVARKGMPYMTKKWYDEEIESDYIEVQTKCKPKAVMTACAYYVINPAT